MRPLLSLSLSPNRILSSLLPPRVTKNNNTITHLTLSSLITTYLTPLISSRRSHSQLTLPRHNLTAHPRLPGDNLTRYHTHHKNSHVISPSESPQKNLLTFSHKLTSRHALHLHWTNKSFIVHQHRRLNHIILPPSTITSIHLVQTTVINLKPPPSPQRCLYRRRPSNNLADKNPSLIIHHRRTLIRREPNSHRPSLATITNSLPSPNSTV